MNLLLNHVQLYRFYLPSIRENKKVTWIRGKMSVPYTDTRNAANSQQIKGTYGVARLFRTAGSWEMNGAMNSE